MNETKWLTGFDGDEMLDFVADRLSPRQWVLLAAAHVRRLWDLLPEGVLRQAVEAAERAEAPLSAADRAAWLPQIDAAIPEAVEAVELAQREIVKSADPDSADQENPVLARPNQVAPAFPLFRAASSHARNVHRADRRGHDRGRGRRPRAVRRAGRGDARHRPPGRGPGGRHPHCGRTRPRPTPCGASTRATNSRTGPRPPRTSGWSWRRRRRSSARSRRGGRATPGGRREKRERAARKQLAKLLREVVGNPFTPPRFDPAWRTSTVVELARGIFADRAFDRLPILADALLDADCDEEQVLRHLPGHGAVGEGAAAARPRVLGDRAGPGAVGAAAAARPEREAAPPPRGVARRLRPRPAPGRRRRHPPCVTRAPGLPDEHPAAEVRVEREEAGDLGPGRPVEHLHVRRPAQVGPGDQVAPPVAGHVPGRHRHPAPKGRVVGEEADRSTVRLSSNTLTCGAAAGPAPVMMSADPSPSTSPAATNTRPWNTAS